MSTPLSETIVASGRLTAKFFTSDNTPGDWQDWIVPFAAPFPADQVRVVATASNDGVDAGLGVVAAVPVVAAVDRNGFTLRVRNSDCARGSAGLHWIAVLERPGQAAPNPIDLRTCVLPSKYFAVDCTVGDWAGWDYGFGRPLPSAPVVVASPRRDRDDLGYAVFVFGLVSGANLLEEIPTVVGVVRDASSSRVLLAGRNGGGWRGRSGMNFVAVSPGTPAPGVIVDSGLTSAVSLPATGGTVGARLDVFFSLPFSTPPIVLTTASDQGLAPGTGAVAAMGIVESVTTHAFTLAAMNTDSAAGLAAFHWVAIGCGISCGAGVGPATTVPPITVPPTPPGGRTTTAGR